MANLLYPKGKEAILSGEITWGGGGDTFKVALVDTGVYTYSAAHDYHDDLSGVIATSDALTALTNTSGQCDAANVNFTSVSGESIEALVIFKETGVSSTSRLIAYIDTGTGLPFSPNSGEVDITWGAYIFAL